MPYLESWIDRVNNIVWGPPLLCLLIFSGIYLTVLLRGVQFRYFFYSLKLIFTRKDDDSDGDLSHFKAFMTAVGAMIGTGSITGVAIAIALGGLGSLFWIWIVGILGMAIKYGEAILAIKYRVINEKGEMCGGPMYYLSYGLKSPLLALLFALFGILASFGIGNMVQSNSVALAIESVFSLSPIMTGLLLLIITAIPLLGGIKVIGKIASFLVPMMALFYLGGALFVILSFWKQIPSVLFLIFSSAFTGQAAFGAFMGSSLMVAIQTGILRGAFSGEVGLGSSSIVAACTKTDSPGRQALISMWGLFFTTIIVCTITGLAIAVTGVFSEESQAVYFPLLAFERAIPNGGIFVTLALIPFAYSTILGWAYYGEKCFEYLFGCRWITFYRLLFIGILFFGATQSFDFVWNFSNIMNGLMSIPNLIGLFGLSRVIFIETKLFESLLEAESKN